MRQDPHVEGCVFVDEGQKRSSSGGLSATLGEGTSIYGFAYQAELADELAPARLITRSAALYAAPMSLMKSITLNIGSGSWALSCSATAAL